MSNRTTRVNFDNTNRGTNGGHRVGGFTADAAGDLVGASAPDVANGDGTVFDIPSIAGSDAGTSASFIDTDGAYPEGGLIAAAGNLPGATTAAFTNPDTDPAAPTATDNTTAAAATAMPTLTTLVSFNGTNGGYPDSLIADAAGDLFGTTGGGGPDGDGTVFEIAETGSGYASTPTTLVNFNGTNGQDLLGGLIVDAAGDLFGATEAGGANGANGDGTVFEIAKTGGGYASTPTILTSFNVLDGAYPQGGLIADAAGDLFGTTSEGGANYDGTVFEIAETGSGYASTPTTLISFNGANGNGPGGDLIADAAGDLFGITQLGGANDDGTVFEIAKVGGSYASTPTTLVSFNGIAFGDFEGSLIADAAGDLFGTTVYGGAYDYGMVFEIAKTSSGYASTPTTLVSFNGTNGKYPGSLIADAAGDLFGTTGGNGTNNDGTVFEIAETGSGYASTPTTLESFNGTNGEYPGSLIADAVGDLFGTTGQGGATGYGTVFELTGTGFQVFPVNPPPPAGTTADMILRDSTNGNYEIYDLGSNAILAAYSSGQVGLQWQVAGLGDFSGNPGENTDMLMRNSNTGAFEAYDISNNTITSSASMGTVGLEWSVSGLGDFSGNPGESDMLMRNSNTGAFEAYDISNNTITSSASMGTVGLEWSVSGLGDFSGNPGESDMLMRNSNTGAFEVYDISHNAITSAAAMGAVGLDWTVAGFGDFSSNPGESDMLMRNSNTGAFEVYDISHNAITSAAAMGAVGLDWTVAGLGDFSSNPGESDMLMRNSNTGAFEVYDISHNAITSAAITIGQVGLEWTVAGIAADSPSGASGASIDALAQAIAAFPSDGAAIDQGPTNQASQEATSQPSLFAASPLQYPV